MLCVDCCCFCFCYHLLVNKDLYRLNGSPYAIGPLSCLSVLSVTLVYRGQAVGRIKMKLGMQVGLGPGHIMLDGVPAPLPPRDTVFPIFGPYLLRPNCCIDQEVTWYGARPRPRRFRVRWGPRSPLPKRSRSPKFSAHVYCGQTLDG